MLMRDCDICDEIFTHIDERTGLVRNFNATKMQQAAEFLLTAGRIALICVAMDRPFIRYMRTHRGLEEWKLQRLVEPYLSIPIIGAELRSENSVLTVDGHHRLSVLESRGDETYMMYLFPEDVWTGYLLTDMPVGMVAALAGRAVGESHG